MESVSKGEEIGFAVGSKSLNENSVAWIQGLKCFDNILFRINSSVVDFGNDESTRNTRLCQSSITRIENYNAIR